jgi:periplasmic divalent cation tolerance protein
LRKVLVQGFIIIFVTAASEQEAASIGRTVVEEGLAACANIIPHMHSIYRWKGEIWDEGETLIIIKSREEYFERIRSRIRELHSYEVPEITAIQLDKGDAAYLQWIEAVTAKGD